MGNINVFHEIFHVPYAAVMTKPTGKAGAGAVGIWPPIPKRESLMPGAPNPNLPETCYGMMMALFHTGWTGSPAGADQCTAI